MNIMIIIVVVFILETVNGCPPQPPGNCYSGTYTLAASSGGFQNQACGNVINREWCAVSYMPATQQANFGCANNFQQQIGGPICGDGPNFINQQGCSMVNTENGPCYFCCCKGGSCNDPRVFAREAAKLPINSGGQMIGGGGGYINQPSYPNSPLYSMPWYNSSNSLSPFLTLLILLFLGFRAVF
ncbi:unnamed protein product [Caenorhabditis angaria]|uniref:Uncharacterized protein n=1 Tax=Caenorhabditis angaria TaxID=860376 RepID=A0A9P1N262_9PELO|nr:unnamed protein product [Caenorhabditis angaria]